jgi:type IV pilus assembly protein PilM
MNTFLDKFFPIPDFLRMPAIGLDISDTMITYTELVYTSKGVGVGRYGQKTLDEGVIVKGVIQDTQKLQMVLSALHQELGIHFARITAPEQLVFSFVITIPKVDHKEISAAIEFQIEEHIPVPKTDLIFDYEIIAETSRNYRLKVNAITEKIFESYHSVLADSGFHVVHFEPNQEANVRALMLADNTKDLVLVDIGKEYTSISVVESGLIISSVSVEFSSSGAGNIDILGDEIMRYYNYWRTKDVKRALFVEEDEVDGDTTKRTENQEKLQAEKQQTISEEKSKGDESQSQQETTNTASSMYPLVICGDIEGLAPSFEQLAKKLNTEVVQATVWNAPDIDGDSKYHIPKTDVTKYVTAIGLALSDF